MGNIDAWRTQLSQMLTSRNMLRRAKTSESAREEVVRRYQRAVKHFLHIELLREKDARSLSEAERLVEAIYDRFYVRVIAELTKGWTARDGSRFRDDYSSGFNKRGTST